MTDKDGTARLIALIDSDFESLRREIIAATSLAPSNVSASEDKHVRLLEDYARTIKQVALGDTSETPDALRDIRTRSHVQALMGIRPYAYPLDRSRRR
jgi:hypothetical protein